MVPLVLAAMFFGLVTTASGQRRGQPWPPGGYGNIVQSWYRPSSHPRRVVPSGQFFWKTGVPDADQHRNSRSDRHLSFSGVR